MEITLALGGGGVKGAAHIGVLRTLEREGYRIRAIAGTSAGGLWGSLYAAGYSPDDIEQIMSDLDPKTIYHRQQGEPAAMLGLLGIEEMLKERLGDTRFQDLRLPFKVTAVDLDKARRVILDRGRVRDAIRATIAVPGIFPPARYNGKTLVDGGVMDPVPVSLARSMAAELPVVAVVLSPKLQEWDGNHRPRLFENMPFVARYLSRLRVAQSIQTLVRSIDIGGAMVTDMRLRLDQPEVIIRPEVSHIGLLDPVDVHTVARLGERAAEAALPQIQQASRWDKKIVRRWRKFQTSPLIKV